MTDRTYYIVTDHPKNPESAVIATTTPQSANEINRKDFAGEGSIRVVTEKELIDEGFDPTQVNEENQ